MNELFLSNTNINKLTKSVNELDITLSKMSKFTNLKLDIDFSSIDGIKSSVQSLDRVLTGVVKGFEGLGSFNDNINQLAEGASVLANAYNFVNDALLGNIANLNLQTIATNIASAASSAFEGVLRFLGANPLMAVIGGIGLLVGALTLLGSIETESEKDIRLFNEAIDAKKEKLDKTTEALKENAEATKENVNAINSDYSLTLGQIDQLVEMTGKDGYVGNVEEAKYLIDQINGVLPNSVELLEDGKLVWKDVNGVIVDNVDAIKQSIEMLKQRAIVEAYEKDYVEAVQKETQALTDKVVAQNALADAKRKYDELRNAGKELSTQEQTEMQNLSEKMVGYEEVIASCDETLAAVENSTRNYEAAQKSLSGTTESMADFMAEQYIEVDSAGKATWESLGAGIMTLDAKLENHTNGVKKMTEDEVLASKLARESIVSDLINKAYQYDLSYDEMIEKLKESGIILNLEEEKHLKASYDAWDSHNKDIKTAQQMGLDTLRLQKAIGMSELKDEDQQRLSDMVKMFASNGNESGLMLCQRLGESLEDSNGVVDTATQDIIDIIMNLDNIDPKVITEIFGPSDKDIQEIKSQLNHIPTSKKVEYGIEDTGLKGFTYYIRPNYRAMGGFPDTGE